MPVNAPTDVSILKAQNILTALGVPHGPEDGLFGPKTKAGWANAANAVGLAPEFERMGPTVAKVWSYTWDALAKRAAAESGHVVGIP